MPADPKTTTPSRIKRVSPAELMIIWADGHESHYLSPVVRRECPCAACRDEMTGARILLPIHVPDSLELRKVGAGRPVCAAVRMDRRPSYRYFQLRLPSRDVSLRSVHNEIAMKRLVIGMSGATGAIYGIRLLEILTPVSGVETHLVITDMGKATITLETDYRVQDVEKLADHVYGIKDLAAAISSGSYRTDGMIVAPCSVKTLSSVANCANDNLLTRAADVTLKQRRKLILLFRETPLHAGHCQLMLDTSRIGAIVMPPLPAFYTKPQTVADIVDDTVARVLDFWDIDMLPGRRWPGTKTRKTKIRK